MMFFDNLFSYFCGFSNRARDFEVFEFRVLVRFCLVTSGFLQLSLQVLLGYESPSPRAISLRRCSNT